ncbi:2-isopropylmalate synthase [Crateriforma conspicua]|uniref:2-isopropylmalate synthase n=1 Tax=Crateriforma conspicua TaxID=2527996 RepID=A0A5C5Y5Z1_9PLAN|nr:2-isopropylmalate synthase [Crateriforma conspicua]QDV65707.1 2-isopropylmalate synthase [Crateriforma conspicua]TWT71107.1 2-isopropylmalate synthase [Crateriforma conspicua]
MSSSRYIRIFDTTLRDGEQSPGCSMNLAEKLEVAQALADLGVDIIEAGFPIASPGDFESVKQIAGTVRGATICGLARCNEKDIDAAWEALKTAPAARIHVFLATSAIHREFKLRMSPDEIVQRAVTGVRRAAGYCDDVEFSPEDAFRTEPDFLCRVVEAAIDAGATTVNIPDTVGYATPGEIYDRIKLLRQKVPNIDKAVISMHCHDDLGMGVANSLAGVAAGAGQIECTINGIGERAGNAALEEVVMAMKTRGDFYQCETGIDSKRLLPTSRLVSKVTGQAIPRNKAIVGRNAFAHESGIHQDGMLKERSTYEIMSPEEVGFTKTDLVLGKHSGRAALADRAKTLGLTLTGEQLQQVFERFKDLADKKKEIYDGDIIALVQQQISGSVPEEWSLVDYEVTSSRNKTPKVSVTLRKGDEEHTAQAEQGDGPIDAAFWAVEKITGVQLICKDFQVRSATLGRDAIGEVNLEVEYKGQSYRGIGVSTDSVESTILAMLNALNRIGESRPADTGDA